MRRAIYLFFAFFFILPISVKAVNENVFPDGTPVSEWFSEYVETDIHQLGAHYRITDHGVANDSTLLQTKQIQAVIDKASANGGGVIIVPRGTFLSGSLFFKPGTHLHLEEGGTLKGSDDVSHFALLTTRMEGQTLTYFAALINADGVNGFTLSGSGTLDGNGWRYWRNFWLRRRFNPQCTNMDEMRPRVLYVSNSSDVHISGVRIINSPYWTTHFYTCENLRLTDLSIFAPHKPAKAPSSDAVDLDACQNVHIKGCYMSVNDDAVCMKGGKGPTADTDDNNGPNANIIIEDCEFGFSHSVLTCGSESVHSRNIIMRRCSVNGSRTLLTLKMRPDTPQCYEYILIEDITGKVDNIFGIAPWTQFFDLKGHPGPILSYANNVTLRNSILECQNIFNVQESEQYRLTRFLWEKLEIKATKDEKINTNLVEEFHLKNVNINEKNVF